MRIRIDLKILIFFALFYLTNQIEIYLTVMFFCIIHELGHTLVGIALKMKPEKLEIIPCGFSMSFKINIDDMNFKIKKGNLLEFKKIIIAIAGPIVSFSLVILYTYLKPIYISIQYAIYSNILICIFNLLPIYPLDGGRIIKGILYLQLGHQKAKTLINQISNITMIIFTLISSIAVYYYKNIAIFLICIFLWLLTIEENRKFRINLKIQKAIQEK